MGYQNFPLYPASAAQPTQLTNLSSVTMPGLAYSVKWSPVFFNQSYKALNGASIDIGYSPYPLHNFELTYSMLRFQQGVYTGTPAEFQTMLGFFAQLQGSLGRFMFDNPDDDVVIGQPLGIGDGVNRTFLVGRSLGAAILAPVEPIGNIGPFANKVYLNGVQQPLLGNTWVLDSSVAGNNLLIFNPGHAPGVGVSVTMDLGYYYYCKFADDTMTFEKFVSTMWSNQSVKIQNCRPGA